MLECVKECVGLVEFLISATSLSRLSPKKSFVMKI